MGNFDCRECVSRDSNFLNELCFKKDGDEKNICIHLNSTNPVNVFQINDNNEEDIFNRNKNAKAAFSSGDSEINNKMNNSVEKMKNLENKYAFFEKNDNKNQFNIINPNSQFVNQASTDQSGKLIVTKSNNITENNYRPMEQNVDNFNRNGNINQIQSPVDAEVLRQQKELEDLKQEQLRQQHLQQQTSGKFKYQQIETYEPAEFSDQKNSLLDNDDLNVNYQSLEYEDENENEELKNTESNKIKNEKNNINLRANINPQLGVKLFAEDKIEAENKKNGNINKMNINEPRDSKRINNEPIFQNAAINYYKMNLKPDGPNDNENKNKNYYQQIIKNYEPRDSKNKKQKPKFQNNIYSIPVVKNNLNEQIYAQNQNTNSYISSNNIYTEQNNYENNYVSSGNIYDNTNINSLQNTKNLNINQISEQKNNDYYDHGAYYYQENDNNINYIDPYSQQPISNEKNENNLNDGNVEMSENKTKDIKNLEEDYRKAVTLGPVVNDVNDIEFAFSMQNKNAHYDFVQNQHPFVKADK